MQVETRKFVFQIASFFLEGLLMFKIFQFLGGGLIFNLLMIMIFFLCLAEII